MNRGRCSQRAMTAQRPSTKNGKQLRNRLEPNASPAHQSATAAFTYHAEINTATAAKPAGTVATPESGNSSDCDGHDRCPGEQAVPVGEQHRGQGGFAPPHEPLTLGQHERAAVDGVPGGHLRREHQQRGAGGHRDARGSPAGASRAGALCPRVHHRLEGRHEQPRGVLPSDERGKACQAAELSVAPEVRRGVASGASARRAGLWPASTVRASTSAR